MEYTKDEPIVVTGMGLVSCLGHEVDPFYEALLQGKSGISPLTYFPCEEYPTRFAGSIQPLDTENYLDKKQARRIDPCIRYAMVAGKKALDSAQFPRQLPSDLDPLRYGILIGSGMGGMNVFYNGIETLLKEGFKRLTPFFVPYIITNMGGALLSIDTGFQGPNYSVSTACATASYAIELAAEHIRNGEADLMVCGGAEAPLTPIGLAGFVAIKALSEENETPQKASRPWDINRTGFVMGEGSAVLVLERLSHAIKRKAPILAVYLGGALTSDAYHMTSPREDGSGVAACIQKALQKTGVAKEKINYINAHATSTPAGDMCEVAAIHQVFKEETAHIVMNGTKSMIGHTLGAAGAFGSIATIKAIQTGLVHPTLNLENPEAGLGNLDPVIGKAKKHKVEVGLVNAFGFGGHNSCLLFAPYTGF